MGHRGVLINRPESERAIRHLDMLQLEALIAEYAIGELIRYWPATAGIENSNYFLRTVCAGTEGHYVLTVLERPANAGDSLVPLLDLCLAAGLPVPRVIRTRTGNAYARLEGKRAMVCTRLPGGHVGNPTLRQIAAVGRFLARLHRATTDADLDLPDYPRDLDWLECQAEAMRPDMGFADAALMRDVRLEVASALARDDVAALPRGPIHADLFRDNVLFNEWGLSGVLDFHHAARGFLIYDLAVAANDWCTSGDGSLDPERALALLRAYHRVRPITRQELWFFPVFALYGALAFWASRLTVSLRKRRGEAVRANDPAEFQRIVLHHRAHFLHLDERQLDSS
jgi:homoserine kinase type II